MVGYSDRTTFDRAFKRCHGIAASVYRRSHSLAANARRRAALRRARARKSGKKLR
jgi:AraC-like DNA-binding protein